MNRKELQDLIDLKVPKRESSDSLKTSYAYLLTVEQFPAEVDLDELKHHLDVLGRLKDLMDEKSQALVLASLRQITHLDKMNEKLRLRVETFKRVTWGDYHADDPVTTQIAAVVKELDNAETRDAAAKWLKENEHMLAPEPAVTPEKLSLD